MKQATTPLVACKESNKSSKEIHAPRITGLSIHQLMIQPHNNFMQTIFLHRWPW